MTPAYIAIQLRSLSTQVRALLAVIDDAARLIELRGNCRESQDAMRSVESELRDALRTAKILTGLLFLLRRK